MTASSSQVSISQEEVDLLVQLRFLDNNQREPKLNEQLSHVERASVGASSSSKRKLLSAEELAKLRASDRVAAKKSRERKKTREKEILEDNEFLELAIARVVLKTKKLKEENRRLKKESKMLKEAKLQRMA